MDKDVTWNAQTLTAFKQIFRLFGEAIKTKQANRAMSLLRDDTIKAFDLVQNPMVVVDKVPTTSCISTNVRGNISQNLL